MVGDGSGGHRHHADQHGVIAGSMLTGMIMEQPPPGNTGGTKAGKHPKFAAHALLPGGFPAACS